MEKWPRDRLKLAFRLLASLPPHPTETVQETLRHLGCPRSSFYRLVADLRYVGFGIEKRRLASGQAAYYLARHDRALLERILRIE